VDAIRALEEAACVITAAQASLARELDASQRTEQATAGVPARRRGKGVAAQVALARRESPERGTKHLALAPIVATELPHTWAAWKAGRVGEWKATLVARETACLDVELRLEVDRLVAQDPDRFEKMADAEVASECARHAAQLDPASVTARRRRAEGDRRVTLRPAPDTMSHLSALLPVKDGVAVLAVLTRRADAARATGDERSRGQLMADALVAAVLGTGDGRVPSGRAMRPTVGTRAREPRLELGLVMSDASLLGDSEDPAHIEGFGPVPAELAREIVVGACSRDEQVWMRRLWASPRTGELVSMDARGRFFRNSLARFIRLRDQVCRTPWCAAPIRHVDHVRRSADGGATSQDNAQGLCEACNHAKDAPGWQARPRPDGSVGTTTPTGHTFATRPPAIARIHHRDLPPLTIDYYVAS
jgi:hypothetical protein